MILQEVLTKTRKPTSHSMTAKIQTRMTTGITLFQQKVVFLYFCNFFKFSITFMNIDLKFEYWRFLNLFLIYEQKANSN